MGCVGLDLRLSGHEPGARLAGVEGSPQGERHRHQLRASPRTGFRHRVADVGAHSLGRNHKLLGDMSAGVTKRDEGENLALARRQLAELRGRRRLLRRLYPDADDDRDSPPLPRPFARRTGRVCVGAALTAARETFPKRGGPPQEHQVKNGRLNRGKSRATLAVTVVQGGGSSQAG